jgi:serine protease Do
MSNAARKASVALLVVAAFLGGVFFITSAGTLAGLTSLFQGADAQREISAADAVASAEDLGVAFANVADRVNPAVVQIRATRRAASGRTGGADPFERFFGVPDGGMGGPQFEQNGLGSGVFVRADGYIVTNNHVIDGADDLRVLLFDGRELDAELVGADPFSDLAVLRVDGGDFPYVGFGDAREVRVGQWALAFGSPLSENLSNTVTNGIISSLGRFQGGRNSISNYIQTDAAVNPGNSGGPLVNIRGEIIGINSAIATRNGGFQGISFAIPVDIVQNTVEQLIDSGTVERGYLGISFGPVSPALARALDVQNGAAQISEITADANDTKPAEEAGLRAGDVITAVDGVQLRQHTQLVSLVANKRPGDTVRLTYSRDGRERTAEVTLGRRPGDDAIAAAQRVGAPRGGSGATASEPATVQSLGLTVQDLTPAVAQRLGLDRAIEGVAVTGVERGSEAAREAQIQPGLVITEVNRKPVKNVREFEAALDEVREGDTFLLRLQSPAGGSFLTALTKS